MSNRREFFKSAGGLFACLAAWSLPKAKGVEQAPLVLAECPTLPIKRSIPFLDLPPLGTMRMEQIALAAQTPMRVELSGPCNESGYWSPFEHFVFPWKRGEKMSFDDFQLEIKPMELVMRGSKEAFIMPNLGHAPVISVEGNDETGVAVPIYSIGSSIGWQQKYIRDNRWDIVGRGLEVFNKSFVRKIFWDQWHTILAAGVHSRNGLVREDSYNIKCGQFTKRFLELCRTVGKDNGATDITDVAIGTNMFENNFGENTHHVTVNGINIHPIDDLDHNGLLYDFYVTNLGGKFPSEHYLTNFRTNLAVFFDCTKPSSFLTLIPEDKQLVVCNDDRGHESMKGRNGLYGDMSLGVICTRPDTVLMGAF